MAAWVLMPSYNDILNPPVKRGALEALQYSPLNESMTSIAPNPNWGARMDGTRKGNGFLGQLLRPDGDISSELSFDFDHGGKSIFAPLIVPTMSKDQLDRLLNTPDGAKIDRDIYDTAQQHAIERTLRGKSTFALPNEVYPLPK